MKKKNFLFLLFIMMMAGLISCEENTNTESDCGASKEFTKDAPYPYFSQPTEIFWGMSGGIRSYTYTFTCENICPKHNPAVRLTTVLKSSNTTYEHPFTISGGVMTCLGVQSTDIILIPDLQQKTYQNIEWVEIGMNQCFGGKSSATIYPFITVSFNTFGSNQADSLYLLQEIIDLKAQVSYMEPK